MVGPIAVVVYYLLPPFLRSTYRLDLGSSMCFDFLKFCFCCLSTASSFYFFFLLFSFFCGQANISLFRFFLYLQFDNDFCFFQVNFPLIFQLIQYSFSYWLFMFYLVALKKNVNPFLIIIVALGVKKEINRLFLTVNKILKNHPVQGLPIHRI